MELGHGFWLPRASVALKSPSANESGSSRSSRSNRSSRGRTHGEQDRMRVAYLLNHEERRDGNWSASGGSRDRRTISRHSGPQDGRGGGQCSGGASPRYGHTASPRCSNAMSWRYSRETSPRASGGATGRRATGRSGDGGESRYSREVASRYGRETEGGRRRDASVPSAGHEKRGVGNGSGESDKGGGRTADWENEGRRGRADGRGLSATPKSIMVGSESPALGSQRSAAAKGRGGAGPSKGRRSGVGEVRARRFACEQCGFAFGMRSNLKRHIMTVHEDRRTFKCERCGSAFGLKQNLATHVRVKHEKRRPFACEVCGMSFGYKQVLQNHRRSIHGLVDD